MDRINGLNTIDIGGGRRGWRKQNKATGVAGTEMHPDFFNSLQEEVLAVIEGAGITADAANWTQLRSAIGSMISAYWITAPVTIYVSTAGTAFPASPLTGGAFDKLSSAMTWLRGRRITSTGFVTVSMGAGVFTEAAQVNVSHPDGDRIEIVGTALLGVIPADPLSTVKATAEASARAIWATQINMPVDGLFVGSRLRRIRNLGLFGGGGGLGVAYGYTPAVPAPLDPFGAAHGIITDCCSHNFDFGYAVRQGSHVMAERLIGSHSATSGVLINNAAYLLANSLRIGSSGNHNVWVRENSFVEATDSKADGSIAGAGIFATNDAKVLWTSASTATSTLRNNALGAARTSRRSGVSLVNANCAGNTGGQSIYSTLLSSVDAAGCINLTGSVSPASGTIGNNNSFNLVS